MFSSNIIDFAAFDRSDHTPPQNTEVEEALLGALIMSPPAIDRVAQIVHTPDVFYLSAHREIYRACLTLHSLNQPTDLMCVTTWLTDQGLLDKVGGKQALARLIGGIVGAYNVESYAELLVDKHNRRRLLQAATQIEALARDTKTSIAQVLDRSEQLVYAIAQSGKPVDLNQVEAMPDICTRVWTQLEQGTQPGLPTGLTDLDTLTGGFYPGTLTIAAGRTSMGKSQMAVFLAHEIANRGLPVVLFTCEMSKEEITHRLLARIASIDSQRLRERQIHSTEWEPLGHAVARLTTLPVHIHSAPQPQPVEMRSVLRRVASQYHGKLGLVILDYIQLLGSSTDNRVQELDKVVREFRAMAKDFQVPCLGLAQINRGVENRKNKRPLLSDIRESGSIENHADVVLLLYRDEYYDAQTSDRGVIEVSVAKNRHGRVGTGKFLFAPQYSLFRNLARGGQP